MFLKFFKRYKSCQKIAKVVKVAKIVKVANVMHMCQWNVLNIPTYHMEPYLSIVSEFALLIQCQMDFSTIWDLLTILLEQVNFTSMSVRIG